MAAIFNQGLETAVQRGHRRLARSGGCSRFLRLAGFALFALSLGKIFIYDPPSLSSITRALSFLAVGSVLLLRFFYQHLSAVDDTREPNGATT